MKRTVSIVSMLIVLAVLLAATAGCSRFLRPTDEEVLKAIDDSRLLKGQSFTITSPLLIVDRGSRDQYGFWRYKITMTLVMQSANGQMSEPKNNTITFKISRSKDSAGNVLWTASI